MIDLCTVPEKQYREAEGLSYSDVSLWLRSNNPNHYLLNKEKRVETDDMRFGSLVHTLALEPDEVEGRFAFLPDINKRTKAGKEEYAQFVTANEHKMVIDEKQHDLALTLATKLEEDEHFSLLQAKCDKEMTCFYEYNGTQFKSRFDLVSTEPALVCDLKTTRCAEKSSFSRSIVDYNYHIQAYLYSYALEQVCGKEALFEFIVVEKTAPFGIAKYVLNQATLDQAKTDLDAVLFAMEKAQGSGYRGYDSNPIELDLSDKLQNRRDYYAKNI